MTSEGCRLYSLYWRSVEYSFFMLDIQIELFFYVTDVGFSVVGTVLCWTFGRGKSLNVRRISNIQHDSTSPISVTPVFKRSIYATHLYKDIRYLHCDMKNTHQGNNYDIFKRKIFFIDTVKQTSTMRLYSYHLRDSARPQWPS